MFRLLLFTSFVLIQFNASAHAQLFRKRIQSRSVYCLKDYGYANKNLSNPETVLSYPALTGDITARRPTSESPYLAGDHKSFAMQQSHLTNDHCRLLNITFQIFRDGRWVASFQAEQNPQRLDEADRVKFIQYLQNRFIITVRFTGADLADARSSNAVAAPVFHEVELPGFWQKQGEITNKTFSGHSDEVRRHFELISRIAVDLRYQK